MDYQRYFCRFCVKHCGSDANYEAHVGGKAHRRTMEAIEPEDMVPALPAQQVMFDGDRYEEEVEHPRVRTAAVGIRAPARAMWEVPAQPVLQPAVVEPIRVQQPVTPTSRPITVRAPQEQPTCSTASSRSWAEVTGGYRRRPIVLAEVAKQRDAPTPPASVSPAVVPETPPGRNVQNPNPWVYPSQRGLRSPRSAAAVPTAVSVCPPTGSRMAKVDSVGGWLRCDKSGPIRRKYRCDLCNKDLDSRQNLRQHRGSKKCKNLAEPEFLIYNSPPLDPEPYIIRGRPEPVAPTAVEEADFNSSVCSSPAPSSSDDDHEAMDVSGSDDETMLTDADTVLNTQEDVTILNPREGALEDDVREEASTSGGQGGERAMERALDDSMRQFRCGQCDTEFRTLPELRTHRRGCSPESLPNARELCEGFESDSCFLTPGMTAMNSVYRSITVTPTAELPIKTSDGFFFEIREGIERVLLHCLENGEDVKVFTTTSITMHKINISDGNVDEEKTFFFSTKATPIQTATDIYDLVDSTQSKVEKAIEKYTSVGSNWIVYSINSVKLCLVRYRVLKAGVDNFVVPAELAAKKCVINIHTEGERCFMYAVVASLHFQEIDDGNRNRTRRQRYDEFVARYNFTNIGFPSTAEDVKQFIKQNEGVAINALQWIPAKGDVAAHVTPVYHPPHKDVIGRQSASYCSYC